MLPDWSDFPPNWATFNHVRLEKLSLGGKSAQSGNAVDNKPGLHCRGAQSERRRVSEICDSEILNAQWKHWKRRTLLTSYYKNHSIHSERGRPLPKIKVTRSNGNVSVVSATWFGARYVLLLCFLGIIDRSRNQKPAVFSFFRFVQKNENQNLSLFIRFLVLLTKTSLPLNIWFPPVGGSSCWLACFIALCSS